MDSEIRDYLTQLVEQLSTREACEMLGYSLNSYSSLKTLLDAYGVEIPSRTNQYTVVDDKTGREYVLAEKVSVTPSQRLSVPIERAVVFGDVHGLQVDKRSFGVLLSIIEDIQPEFIYINGDFIDFGSISRFSKDPREALQFQEEIDNANGLLDALQASAPNAKCVYIEGNHEVRLREYLRKNAPSLIRVHSSLDETPLLSVENLLRLPERGIDYVPQVGKSGYTRYGAITIGHFDKYSSIPGAVAKWFMQHRNESVIQAHTHKCAQLYRRFPDGREITCIEHGHLMMDNPDYVTDPDWCQGFVVITKRTETDRFHTELVRVIDHECLFEGVLYSG